MRLSIEQKKFMVVQLVLFFLFISLLWFLDVSVSFIYMGRLDTLLFSFKATDSYHIALIGLVAVYFTSLTVFMHYIHPNNKEKKFDKVVGIQEDERNG